MPRLCAGVLTTSTPGPVSSLAFAQTGAGRDVVLVHGALTSLDDMAIALFDRLEGEFRVTAFDRPGHGRNPAPDGGTPRRQAQQLHEAVQALGLKRPVVVGHSFGGAVALAYGLQFPDAVSGILALSPIAFPEPRLEHLLFAPRALPGPLGFWSHSLGRTMDAVLLPLMWRAMFLPQAMPAKFVAEFPFSLDDRSAQLLSEGQDASLLSLGLAWNAARYATCAAPVHVMIGDADLVVNPHLHAHALARRLPKARLTKLPGLGHMVHHFAQGAVAQAIRDLHAA